MFSKLISQEKDLVCCDLHVPFVHDDEEVPI